MTNFRVLLLGGLVSVMLQAQPAPEQLVPTLLSSAEDSVDPLIRAARSKLFHAGFSIFETGPEVPTTPGSPTLPPPISYVSLWPMQELPMERSDAVLIGEVTAIHPHVTNDQKGLYTEFTVRVSEWIKAVSPDHEKSSIAFLRRGGKARLPDGRIVEWVVKGEGDTPLVGSRYLLFLQYRRDADAYLPWKMWVVEAGNIYAVSPDDLGRVARGESIYHGKPLLSAISDLRILGGR